MSSEKVNLTGLEPVEWSADLFFDPPKLGGPWLLLSVTSISYSTPTASKSTGQENRPFLCQLKDGELGWSVSDVADAVAVPS